jgi:hypothetical protein
VTLKLALQDEGSSVSGVCMRNTPQQPADGS